MGATTGARPGDASGPVPVVPDGAVVLAGGSGRRLGGVDKATLVAGGRTLLDAALAAAHDVATVVVVGPAGDARRSGRARRFGPPVREVPAGGGPAAALLAGVRALGGAGTVLVLAVDMPRVTAATVARLAAALEQAGPGTDGALLRDVRRQPLCGVYRSRSLLNAAPADPDGLPVHRLLEPLSLVEVAALPGEAHDVDTWSDLEAADLP